jgi:hypothetical protein
MPAMDAPNLTSSLDPEDLALELGSTINRKDGTVFNAAGRAGAQRLRLASNAAPPTPVTLPSVKHAVEQPDIASILKELVHKMQPVVQHAPAAPQVIVAPAPKTSWEFTFVRNKDGSIQSIKASPT